MRSLPESPNRPRGDQAAAITHRQIRSYRDLATELNREYTVGHADAARLESELRGRAFGVLGVEYAAQATLRLGVPESEAARLSGLLAELTGGTAVALAGDDRWVDR